MICGLLNTIECLEKARDILKRAGRREYAVEYRMTGAKRDLTNIIMDICTWCIQDTDHADLIIDAAKHVADIREII